MIAFPYGSNAGKVLAGLGCTRHILDMMKARAEWRDPKGPMLCAASERVYSCAWPDAQTCTGGPDAGHQLKPTSSPQCTLIWASTVGDSALTSSIDQSP